MQFLSSDEVSYQYYRIICNNLKKMYLFVFCKLMYSDAKWPHPSEKPRFDYRVVKVLAKREAEDELNSFVVVVVLSGYGIEISYL